MDPQSLKKINAERRAKRPCVHVTEIAKGRDRVIKCDDAVAGALGEAVREVFVSGQSALVTVDDADYFLNVHKP